MKKIWILIIGIIIGAVAGSIIITNKTNSNIFTAEKFNNNVYDLPGIKGWFYIDQENNEYLVQFYELGDYDYKCNDITEMKKILETYYIQKYNIKTDKAIAEVERIFNEINKGE